MNIIFGIDAPKDQILISALDQICSKNGFNRQRYVATKHDKDWNMPLCHIIWDCINACENDKALMVNVDSIVLSSIMTGFDIVGRKIKMHLSEHRQFIYVTIEISRLLLQM